MNMTDKPTPPTILLIDGMSLVFQAFYAIRGLTNAQGMPTGAILGFTRQVQALLTKVHPTHVAAIFDSPGGSFRNQIYEAYKANRQEAPEDFHQQLPYIFRILDAMHFPRWAHAGFEADDLIGALATRAAQHGMRAIIATADKDLFQLVTDQVSVLRTRKDDMAFYGPDEVRARMGVGPELIVDYLALVGDTSDNIPGVPGIGPKTAVALLEEFGSLDVLLQSLDRVPNERRRNLLRDNVEKARLAQRLARIDCNAPVALTFEQLVCQPDMASPELVQIYRELGFSSLLRDAEGAAPRAPSSAQTTAEPPPTGEAKRKPRAPQSASPAPPSPSASASSVAAVSTQPPSGRYSAVFDVGELQRFVAEARRAGRLAIDTETTALDPMQARLVGISLSCRPGEAIYVPVGHEFGDEAARQLPLEAVREALGPILGDAGLPKIAQNAKFDMRILQTQGFPFAGLRSDPMLASYVLNPEARHGLKAMALEFLGVRMTEIVELIGSGRSIITMDQVEVGLAAPYACADADLTLQLADHLEAKLEQEGLQAVYRDMEIPLVEVLTAMETEGVTIDKSVFAGIGGDLRARIKDLAERIYEAAGHPFTINSPKQVAQVLFHEMGLKTSQRSASESTRSEILEELRDAHPLPGLILEYRQFDKLLSTYVDALPQMVQPRTGRIHTTFNQFVAATGRLSSTSPNLQNIPIRSSIGKAIRAAFVPNGPGEVLLGADYSQIELRVLAHVTGDAALRRAFVEGVDIHRQTAARVFGIPSEMVSDEMRSQAKVINFGILYGMSAHRLSRELAITRAQAQKFIDEYFAAYPGVRRWSDAMLEKARETGYVSTLSGRRRRIANLNVRNRTEQANAERMAVNTPIQGTAADMIKIAMIRLHRRMRAEGWKARMVLQVHDELVFTLPKEEAEGFGAVVREEMENALPLEVPVHVDLATGRNWAEC